MATASARFRGRSGASARRSRPASSHAGYGPTTRVRGGEAAGPRAGLVARGLGPEDGDPGGRARGARRADRSDRARRLTRLELEGRRRRGGYDHDDEDPRVVETAELDEPIELGG